MLAALAITAALVAVPLARADGDPASDVLYATSLFPSYDGGISAGNLEALKATLADSKKAGYEIRVAIIAKPDDLGSVTALWAKPRQYARFLGTELGIVYKSPVLIVMPNGVGFYHGTHDTKSAYAALSTVQTGTGNQLAQAAVDSVATLARQAGHPFTPHTVSTTSTSGSRTLLIRLGIALTAVVAVLGFVGYRVRRHR